MSVSASVWAVFELREKLWSRPSSVKPLSWRNWLPLPPTRRCLGIMVKSPARKVRGGFTPEHNQTASFCKLSVFFCCTNPPLSVKGPGVIFNQNSVVFCLSEWETERSWVLLLSLWCTGKQCTIIKSSKTNQGNTPCQREQSLTQSGR